MSRQVAVVLYVVAMAAVIVGVDFAFLRNRFWERLAVNIGYSIPLGTGMSVVPRKRPTTMSGQDVAKGQE